MFEQLKQDAIKDLTIRGILFDYLEEINLISRPSDHEIECLFEIISNINNYINYNIMISKDIVFFYFCTDGRFISRDIDNLDTEKFAKLLQTFNISYCLL